MPNLRVFDRISRQMQRLGYLKRLVKRVVSSNTSSVDNLGNDLVDVTSKKVRTTLNEERVSYIKIRLYDRAYKTLKEQADQWLKNKENPLEVVMELQDLYLADTSLPSQVGKLVKADWDIYPGFSVNLGLVRDGTFSANTRALSFMQFIPDIEIQAFQEYLPEHNPLALSKQQSLLLLYSFLENDGEVIFPLWKKILKDAPPEFNDRLVGDFIPSIYREIITRYKVRMLPIELRERLAALEKSSESIAAQFGKERYSGGSSREHASRPRIEPFADIGIFNKPHKMKYEYSISEMGRVWISALDGFDSTAIEEFLARRFFNTAAQAWQVQARELTAPDEIIPYLQRAAKAISSSSGYAPIEELALVSGIWALIDDQNIIEPGVARDAVIAYQKANPYKVRFTVDRSGVLAHARFMDDQSAS